MKHTRNVAFMLVILTSSLAWAGISIDSQTRDIQISGSTNPSGSTPGYSQSQTATPSAAFNQSLTDKLSDNTTSQASENSLVSLTGNTLSITATGAASGAGGEQTGSAPTSIAKSSSEAIVAFTLDTPGTYDLTYNFTPDGGNIPMQAQAFLSQGETNIAGLDATMFDSSTTGVGHVKGVLQPGIYSFTGDEAGTAGGGDYFTSTYSYTLNVSTSVPLPNPALLGLAGLLVAMGSVICVTRLGAA